MVVARRLTRTPRLSGVLTLFAGQRPPLKSARCGYIAFALTEIRIKPAVVCFLPYAKLGVLASRRAESATLPGQEGQREGWGMEGEIGVTATRAQARARKRARQRERENRERETDGKGECRGGSGHGMKKQSGGCRITPWACTYGIVSHLGSLKASQGWPGRG